MTATEKPSFMASMSRLSCLSSQPSLLLHTLAAGRPSVADPDFQSRISSIISRHKWSELRPIIQSSTPADFLHHLIQFSNFDSDLITLFYKWSQQRCKVAYSVEDHISLFILLANEKKYPDFRCCLHLLCKQTVPISISAFCHSHLSDRDNVCANSVVFDMLILNLVNNGNVGLAFEGFKRAGDYGFKLSLRSCNSMLAELVRSGRVGDLEFAYKEMLRRRVKVDLNMFNTVVSGLCIVEDMSFYRVAIFDLMLKKKVSPNVSTYNCLIGAYYRDGSTKEANDLLDEMENKCLKSDVVTYNVMM